MRKSRRALVLVAVFLVAALTVPVIAQAATIAVNTGVKGAKLNMNDKKAAKKIGKVKKKMKDTSYSTTVWVRFFGKKSKGHYAVEMYSNGKHKVTAFIIYTKSYKTKKGIHVGSKGSALRKAYKGKLHKESGGYYLKSKTGKTHFELSKGRVTQIWIWRL